MPEAVWPYLGIFAWLLACGLGLPLPEDVPLLTAGFLCHEELASLYMMIPVALLGVLIGDCFLFGIGRWYGPHVTEHRLTRRLVRRERLLMAEKLFARHGVKIIIAGRFLPGFRPMIFMACGVLRVSFWRFVAVNAPTACISVPVLVLLGKLFGHHVDQIQQDVRIATHTLSLVALVAALTWTMLYLYRRQRRMISSARAEFSSDACRQAGQPAAGEPLQFDPGPSRSEQPDRGDARQRAASDKRESPFSTSPAR